MFAALLWSLIEIWNDARIKCVVNMKQCKTCRFDYKLCLHLKKTFNAEMFCFSELNYDVIKAHNLSLPT